MVGKLYTDVWLLLQMSMNVWRTRPFAVWEEPVAIPKGHTLALVELDLS